MKRTLVWTAWHRSGLATGGLLAGWAIPAMLCAALVCLTGCAGSTSAPEPPPPSPARFQLDQGAAAIQRGETAEGIELCEAALRSSGDDREVQAEAHRWLVHGYTLAVDPERALEHCGPGIELQPDDPWMRYAQGIALRTIGELDEAIGAFGVAVELDLDHLKAYQWRADTLQLRERHAEAIEDWTRALEILEDADPAYLASWGGERESMITDTLFRRADSLDAVGEHDRANRDRELARERIRREAR